MFGLVLQAHKPAFVEAKTLQRHADVLAREDLTRHNKPRQNKADTTRKHKSAKEITRRGYKKAGDLNLNPFSPPRHEHSPLPPHTASQHSEKWDLNRRNGTENEDNV